MTKVHSQTSQEQETGSEIYKGFWDAASAKDRRALKKAFPTTTETGEGEDG